MPNQISSPDSRLKSALLIAIVLFLSASVIYLGFYFYDQYRENKKTKEEVSQQESLLNTTTVLNNIDTNSPIYVSELPIVYSRSGEVNLVNPPYVYMKAKFRLNNQLVEKTLKIITDSSTKFLQYNLEELIKVGAENADKAKTTIAIEDLKVGDQITAVSKDNEDIKNMTEFLASSVEKQI